MSHRLFIAITLAFVRSAAAAQATDTTRYTILMAKGPSGVQKRGPILTAPNAITSNSTIAGADQRSVSA